MGNKPRPLRQRSSGGNTTEQPPAAAATGQVRPRRWQEWGLRLVAMIIVPGLLISAVELGLRVAGIGYPTSYFVRVKGQHAYTANQCFGWRFFPRELARTPPLVLVPEEKPAGAIRIFVLGGSAAMGTPDPAFGLARTLRVLLADAYPAHHFEVHNAAMTAISSHVVREIARECCELQPDLLVVYLGNNEVVGPFGPGTVFQSVSGSRFMIRLGLLARSLRIGQTIEGALRTIKPATDQGRWRGLEMFTGRRVGADDPRLEGVYRHLRQNLGAITRHATARGAEVVLSTVATNLRDCPPFASVHRAGLDESQLSRWESAYQRAQVLAAEGDHEQALAAFSDAAAIDDGFAELHFRLAESALAAGRVELARTSFSKARNLDALRFRADTRVNEIIREVARAAGPPVHLAEAEQALAAADESRSAVLGGEVFHEHVHLRYAGTYLLARAIAESVQNALGSRLGAPAAGGWISANGCAERLALTDWDRYRIAAEIVAMTRRPPFGGQLGHEQRQQARQARLRGLRARARARMGESLQAHQEALERAPDDLVLRIRLAELLQDHQQYEEAARHWQILLDTIPGDPYWHTQLGFALLDSSRTAAAVEQMKRAIALRPELAAGHVNLAIVYRQRGDDVAAEQALNLALDKDPGSEAARLNLAMLLADRGQLGEAAQQYDLVLGSDPHSAAAHLGLATVREQQGRYEKAVASYRQALAVDPDLAQAGNNLGYLLHEMGRADEAETVLMHTIAANPGHSLAHFNLADLLLAQGRVAEAVDFYTTGLQLEPGRATARINLAVALQMLDQPAAAITQYRLLLQQEPDHLSAHTGLAWLLASSDDPALRDSEQALRLADAAENLNQKGAAEVDKAIALIREAAGRPE